MMIRMAGHAPRRFRSFSEVMQHYFPRQWQEEQERKRAEADLKLTPEAYGEKVAREFVAALRAEVERSRQEKAA